MDDVFPVDVIYIRSTPTFFTVTDPVVNFLKRRFLQGIPVVGGQYPKFGQIDAWKMLLLLLPIWDGIF